MHFIKFKQALSAALCISLIAVLAVPAVAAQAAAPCGCGEVVHVWIDGFGQALYYDEGTPEETRAPKSDTSSLMGDIPGLLLGAARSVLSFSWDPLAVGISEILLRMMVYYRLDENGNSVAPISSHWVIDPEQEHETNPRYSFRYDFRADPFDVAAQLNDFNATPPKHGVELRGTVMSCYARYY